MKKLGYILLLAVVVMSCKNEQAPETKEAPQSKKQAALNEQSAPLKATFSDSTVARLYNQYNLIKTALVNTNGKEAQTYAAALLEQVEGQPANESLMSPAQAIAQTTDVNTQREAFSDLTAAMLTLVEANITEGTLYYQFCPMAFSGQGGYWLSNASEIRNPYFGDQMLSCGAVDRKIKP
ncbi:DUF3347 domain-containing protein [Croceiramulus getboli]|nr:DUF3347 domain-containing protein [Flavobacteriaceae bacterium YJPT1-3]